MAYNPHFAPKHFENTYGRNCIMLFIESEDYSGMLVNKDYAISQHAESSTCSLDSCRYHVILYHENIETLWKLLESQKFRYHLATDVYAYFKLLIMNNFEIEVVGELFMLLRKAVKYNRCMPGAEHRPSGWRKAISRRAFRTHNINLRNVAVQTPVRHLDTRLRTILEGPRAAEFLKIIDSFYDDLCN